MSLTLPMGIQDNGWTTRLPGIFFLPSRHTYAVWVPCWLDQYIEYFEKGCAEEVEGTLFSSWDELEFG